MNSLNRFFIPSIAFGLALFMASGLHAQVRKNVAANNKNVSIEQEATSEEGAIIFRIEDIKPLTNDNGLTDKCSFIVTVFNRMEQEIKEASLDFVWKDSIAAKYKIANDTVQTVSKPEDALTIITKNVMLENILPHRQKSFEFTVETDKCFLLLDQLEYKVNSCIAEGDKIIIRNNRRIGTGSCINRFDYINSQNPEYYSEFKDVPESVLQQQMEDAKEAELEGINKAYGELNSSLDKINEELDKITTMPEEKENTETKEENSAEESLPNTSAEKQDSDAKDDNKQK